MTRIQRIAVTAERILKARNQIFLVSVIVMISVPKMQFYILVKKLIFTIDVGKILQFFINAPYCFVSDNNSHRIFSFKITLLTVYDMRK